MNAQADMFGKYAVPAPGILWGRHRFHSLARWMLLAMPANEHQWFLSQGRLPGDERDYRMPRTPCDTFTSNFQHYLFINRLVLRAQRFAEQHPAQAPTEHFLHWWQCGIEAVGEQFFLVEKTVPHGNYWNASNIWEISPKEQCVINAHSLFLDTPEQKTLLCFMVGLYHPPRYRALAQQLDVDMEGTRHLQADTRRIIFNLLATFNSF